MFRIPLPAELTMRTIARLPLLLLLALPALAEANCYSMYDGRNNLSFQSTVAPVDLSMPISSSMRSRFPGLHLVIVPDLTDCREYRSGNTVRPRLSEVGQSRGSVPSADQELSASPFFTNVRPDGSPIANPNPSGSELGAREAARQSGRSGASR
jgi:hypothetical protein